MGGQYSLLNTSDDGDVMTPGLTTNNRITSRPDCALQIREPIHHGNINSLASVQNDIVISAGTDRQIVVQDLDAGGFITKFAGHEKEVTKIVYSHVNNNDLVLSGSIDETIRLWQFGVPAPTGIWKAEGMKVSGLAIVNDDIIISGSTDERMRSWDIHGQKTPLRCVYVPENSVTHISTNSQHSILAQTSLDKTLRIWDTRSLALLFKSPPKHFPLLHCDVKDDGLYCLTSSDGNQNEGCEVSLWDLRQQKVIHNFYGHENPVRSAIFLPQQITWKRLIASISSEDFRVFIWDKDQGVCVWQESLTNLSGGHLICCAGFEDGGIVTGGTNGYLNSMKLFNESREISVSTQSIQANFYQSLQAVQDLEAMGLG